jgi:hypothetical protein
MSGFEVAGVVLAVWPMLIEASKFYAEERGVSANFPIKWPAGPDSTARRSSLFQEDSRTGLWNSQRTSISPQITIEWLFRTPKLTLRL